MSEQFDFEEALKEIQSGERITGKDGVLAPLVKQLTEAALECELDSHLADEVVGNRRNGKFKKMVKSISGEFELEAPPDRAGLPAAGKLTDLQNRGVSDILIASADGLTGFPKAIASIYLNTEVQLCIMHQICNTLYMWRQSVTRRSWSI